MAATPEQLLLLREELHEVVLRLQGEVQMLNDKMKEKDSKNDEVARLLREEVHTLKTQLNVNEEGLQEEMKSQKEKVKKKEVDVFANKKGFVNLPNYNGKAEGYDDWHFKVTTFLEVENEFKSLLEFTEKLQK